MRPALALADQMTIDEFLAFTDERPDGERWELIEGAAIMNASPTDWHQTIVLNIAAYLRAAKIERQVDWNPVPGIGTRVPIAPNSLPQPDVMVLPGPLGPAATPVADDALAVFEVLSKSNTNADQAWRRRIYASIPNCQYYVTVSSLLRIATRYDRASGWRPQIWREKNDAIDLPTLGVSLPLNEVYRFTPFA